MEKEKVVVRAAHPPQKEAEYINSLINAVKS